MNPATGLAIRPVPTVPGVFAIRFAPATECILMRIFVEGCWKYFELGDSSNPRYCVERLLAKCRKHYRKRFPADRVSDQPKVVIERESVEPDGYTIMKLGPRLVVAYSPHFFASFNPIIGRWMVLGVAYRPGEFLKVKLPADSRLTAVLSWNGRGIESTEIVELSRVLQAAHPGNLDLLQPRVAPDPIQMRRLYLVGEKVVAETFHHHFLLCENADEVKWTVSACGPDEMSDHAFCFYRDKKCVISGEERYMVIETDEDWESDSSDSPDEDLDGCIVNDNVFYN